MKLNFNKQKRSVMERIEDMSIPVPESGCWLWLGNCYTDGYPQIQINKRPMRVNRAVLNEQGIDIENKVACHTCDTPLCVNPNHIWAGSQSQNIQDSWDKGRQVGRWGKK